MTTAQKVDTANMAVEVQAVQPDTDLVAEGIRKAYPEYFSDEFLQAAKLEAELLLRYFKAAMGIVTKGPNIRMVWAVEKALFAHGKQELVDAVNKARYKHAKAQRKAKAA